MKDNPHPANIIKIETAGEKPMVLDFNRVRQRAWMIRHLEWAMHNRRELKISQTTDAITFVER